MVEDEERHKREQGVTEVAAPAAPEEHNDGEPPLLPPQVSPLMHCCSTLSEA